MENKDKPAYPLNELPPNAENAYDYDGLTKREMFAMAAMQGVIACPNVKANNEQICKVAVSIADELLKQLEK